MSLKATLLVRVFVALQLLLLAIINVAYYRLLGLAFSPLAVVYAWLIEWIAFGLSYELAEMLMAFCLKPLVPPRIAVLNNYPRVAIVCPTADDADIAILRRLSCQNYPRCSVFILDDSRRDDFKALVDSVGLTVVRREDRRGFKAGNLNNWLRQYAAGFEYFVVADADSILHPTFVEQMLLYAQHPDNQRVAVFETLIEAWNVDNDFVRLQNVMAPVLHRRKLCFESRLEAVLSVGHNNFWRTALVTAVGGFQEEYLAEDYATSLELLREHAGAIKVVPIISHERLPANLTEFARRHARWAFQTFQLAKANAAGLRWSVRLKLLRALQIYAMPVTTVLALTLLIVANCGVHVPVQGGRQWLASDTITLFWIGFILVPHFLRIAEAARCRVHFREYVRSALLHSTFVVALLWPTLRRLSGFVSGDRLAFNVTGTSAAPTIREIIQIMGPGLWAAWFASLTIFVNPMVTGLNLIWLVPGVVSPMLIYRWQQKRA